MLKITGVKTEDIIEEYDLSIGVEKIDHIYTALEGIRDLEAYFRGIDLQLVKNFLLGDSKT